jgi:hypothetical protein
MGQSRSFECINEKMFQTSFKSLPLLQKNDHTMDISNTGQTDNAWPVAKQV